LDYYTDEDDIIFMQLYEKYGSFKKVMEQYKKIYANSFKGKGLMAHTITRRLKAKFSSEGRDFNDWLIKYRKRESYNRIYSDKDDEIFERLYEKLGSFKKVAKVYNDSHKEVNIYDETVSSRLRKKFKKEGRDFEAWAKLHYKGIRPYIYHSISYSDDDDIVLMELFEKFGSFKKVSEYYRDAHDGIGPYHHTIKQRLKNKFLNEGKNFDKWFNQYYNPMTSRVQQIGIYLHIIMEYIFIEFTRSLNLNSFFEVKPCKYNSNNICDNSIVRDVLFKDFIEQQQNLIVFSERIKLINVDFSFSTQSENIIIKCFKDYQSSEKFLIIVLLSVDNLNYDPLKKIIVPYFNNVKILNFKEFAQFMNYNRDPKLLDQFFHSIQLAREATNNDEAFNTLEKLAQTLKYNLERIADDLKTKLGIKLNPIRQEGFEYTLKSLRQLYLLFKDRSDISLDKFIF